ncbi:centrosomal protein of 112 kDa isoform X2 [Salmo salar]|uniref:Centrosomal protein of 112 kDa isoform X2 n=1 Tax=Salmo salar TaxID=8030 RepID=A0ABM3EY84_SALSA|nr:centrosomal protein of 112 kDa isoform X2 [Salmo salar]
MNKQEETWEKLDSEFDHHLVDMKPYVLKLPHKTERQRCALWIKKLCDPGVSGSGLMGRKNRNMYARLLLHMLRRGVLEGPFSHKPESGSLKTLPTYMSIYFDEPLCGRGLEQSTAGLPDWVTGELGQGDDSWDSLLRERASSSPTAYSNTHRRRRLYEEMSPSRPLASSPVKGSSEDHIKGVDGHRKPVVPSPDDSDLEARLNSWNLGIENPRYLRENPIPLSPIFLKSSLKNSTVTDEQTPVARQEKEAEMKTKVLEAKHQEEKLKMQQKHDADVQKILDRKNGEIDELKTMYRAKQKESEESVRKLEKKVQSVVRESQVIRESKEKQIGELKKMSDQSTDSLKNEWEKKEQTVRELELRVKQLSVEVENGNVLRQKVTQEKGQLEIHIATISSELQEANRRRVSLLREKEQQSEQHEDILQKLQTKHETDISHFQQEHTLSAAKASDVIEDLEQTVAQLRQQLQDSEHRRLKQLRDTENKLQQEKADLQHDCEKKVRVLHNEAEKEREEAKKKISKLEESLKEKEEQMGRERECQRQQTQQAENALEHFKKQVEISSEKTYANMKLQMDKVEEDLTRSKSLREKQAKEFSYQVEELKQKYEQQMCEQRAGQEQERMRLQQHYSTERDNLVQQRQREVGTMEREARAALHQHQQQTQEWRQRDAQVISDLEEQVSSLRDELQQAHSQRKQQLLELGVLREEERQRAAQDQEASLGRLRAEMDHIRLELETSHKAERQLAQDKTNTRLKQIEKEFSQKLAKSAQLIAELQTSVCDAKEEGLRQQQEKERQLKEATARWDDERRQMSRHTDTKNKVLQEKVENLQRQLHSSEKKLLNKELENQEQVTVVLQECAMKMKGLMPAELRQELEDTISSLKSQVNFLQKRASVLQEDLDACHSRR